MVARAIHHAHERGILHRDLKPSNILIDDRGQPQVADFGLARRLDGDSDLTRTGVVLGTPSYMAPEQAGGQKGAVTTATDVHGLGAILYFLLTGRPPYSGLAVREILNRAASRAAKGAEHDPSGRRPRPGDDLPEMPRARPSSTVSLGRAVADDLERWLDGRPIRPRGVLAGPSTWRLCRRHPHATGLAAAVIVLAVAVVAGARRR